MCGVCVCGVCVYVCVCVVSSNDYVTGESRDFVFHTLNTVPATSQSVIWYLSQALHTFRVAVKVGSTPGTTCTLTITSIGLQKNSASIQEVPLHRITLGLVCGVL
jgi:hypothetical protein